MDTRLFALAGQRPHRLRRQDLPEVAEAIVHVVRKRAKACVGVYKDVAFVRLFGGSYNVVILKDDWELIFPFIQDGTFNPLLVPVQSGVGYLQPNVADIGDTALYQRVLNVLKGVFRDEYPTTTL